MDAVHAMLAPPDPAVRLPPSCSIVLPDAMWPTMSQALGFKQLPLNLSYHNLPLPMMVRLALACPTVPTCPAVVLTPAYARMCMLSFDRVASFLRT